DVVIDYTQEDFAKNGRHYDLLLDNVGNRSLSSFRQVMIPGGRCVMAGAPKTLWAVITRILQALARSLFLRQKFTLFIAKLNKDGLSALCELMKTGKVTTVIDRRYYLNDAADAIAYVEQGHARAKVVINFEENLTSSHPQSP